MSGVDAVLAIRQEEERSALPRVVIVGVTGNALTEDLLDFKLAGCDEVFFKLTFLHLVTCDWFLFFFSVDKLLKVLTKPLDLELLKTIISKIQHGN